jgi:hypothetical protein
MKNLFAILFVFFSLGIFAQSANVDCDCNQPVSWSSDVSGHLIIDKSCENCFFFAYKNVFVGFENPTYRAGDKVIFTNRCDRFYLSFKDRTYMFANNSFVSVNTSRDHYIID